MTVYYSIVFVILVIELPIPTRWQKPIFRWLATSPSVAHVEYVLKVVFVFIFLLFLDSVNTIRSFQDLYSTEEAGVAPNSNATDYRTELGLAAKKFYAQRNLYLTGFTMLLLLILNKIQNMTLDYIRLEDDLIKLEGQTTTDPTVRAAAAEADTEPIMNNVTKLEPVQQENRKDI
ncbi:B-cell receptor-associated protein 31-like-domain-containing protein [Pilobolus umbonatus]|nr:B-cell receptor-associated protein 31-like-domain-containing protein [Pilobolus umbonatus]